MANKQTYENGAVILENGVVLDPDEEIDVYKELKKEISKLLNNVEGLGRKELPEGTEEEVRAKGLEILKANYSGPYDKLVKRIGELANEYIKINCFHFILYKDAAESMLIDPVQMIQNYINQQAKECRKAIFTDYSVDNFTKVVDGIHEKVVALAWNNWQKHNKLMSKKK